MSSDGEIVFPGDFVGADDLVGRDDIVDGLVERLKAGRNVVLMAPRRVGKTSIAHEVLRRLREAGLLTAYVDFFGVTDMRQFAEKMAAELHVQGFRRRLRQVGESMPNFNPHLTFAMLELGVDISSKEADEQVVFSRALELPERAAGKRDTRAIVCLDEFQEAAANFGHNIYKLMRSTFQQQRRTSHLFLGSQQSMLRRVFSASNAPFLRYADEIAIPPVPAEAWARYIVAKFGQQHIGCSTYLAARIAVRAGCHPADTMVLCSNLYFLARAYQAAELDDELLEAATSQTALQLKTYFDAIWSELTDRAKERLVAQRIAQREPITRGIHQQEASAAVKRLIDKGVVVRTGRGAYEYVEPLFKEYVLAL